MKKKIIYILPLISITTLTCKTLDPDMSRIEIEQISNSERNEDKTIDTYVVEDDYHALNESFLENNSAKKLPEDIKFLDMSDHRDDDNIKAKYKPKKVVSEPSKSIIINKQENNLNTITSSLRLKNDNKPVSSIDLTLSSDTTRKLNHDSSYLSFMEERKNIEFIKLKHLEYRTDSIGNNQKIEKVKNNEASYNTNILYIITFCVFSILFLFIVNFLMKKIR